MFGEGLNIFENFKLIKSTVDHDSKKLNHEDGDLSSINFEEGKSIITFCGNNTKSPIKAINYARSCYSWLQGNQNKDDVTIYSIYYPKEQPLLNGYYPNRAFNYNTVAEALFNKIIPTKSKGMTVDKIVNTFSNTTFFAHSVGAYIMNEVMSGLKDMMRAKNYTLADIANVYSSIVCINYAPFALIDAPINNICIAPIYDSVGSAKLVYDKMKRSRKVITPHQNIFNNQDLRKDRGLNFTRLYNRAVNKDDSMYYRHGRSLFVTPTLLYDDGTIEDHNLAGVINYSKDNPYKTKAGRKTTEFMREAFGYSLARSMNDFSVQKLSDESLQSANNDQVKFEEKELQ